MSPVNDQIARPSTERSDAGGTARPRAVPRPYGAAPVVIPLVGLALLPFVVIAFAAALGVRGEDLTIVMLAMVTFSLAGAPLVIEQGREYEQRHVMYSLIALVFIARFAVPAITIYVPAVGAIDAPGMADTHLLPSHIVMGQVMVILGLLAFICGYALPIGRVLGTMLPRPRLEWDPGVTLALGALMIPLGWAVYALQALDLIPERAGTGVVGTIATANIYANVLLTVVAVRHRSSLAAILIGINVVIGGLYGLITSDKEEALVRLAIVVVTTMLLTGRIRGRWIAAGVLAVALIYPVSELVRQSQGGVTTAYLFKDPGRALGEAASLVRTADPVQYLAEGIEATTRRFDGLGVASVLIRDTPRVSPYQNGRTLWLFFVAFVPRTLWPAKPNIQLGQWITDVYGSGSIIKTYIAPTPIGEYYINFGVAGVVLGMLFFGVLLRVAQEVLLSRSRLVSTILASAVLVYNFSVKFTASIAGLYSQIVFALIPIVMIHVFVTRFLASPGRLPVQSFSGSQLKGIER